MFNKSKMLILAASILVAAVTFSACNSTDPNADLYSFSSLDLLVTNEYIKDNDSQKEIDALNWLYEGFKPAAIDWGKKKGLNAASIDDTNRKVKFQEIEIDAGDAGKYYADITVHLAVENPYSVQKDEETYTEKNTNVWVLVTYDNFSVTAKKRALKDSEYASLETAANELNASLQTAINDAIKNRRNSEEYKAQSFYVE